MKARAVAVAGAFIVGMAFGLVLGVKCIQTSPTVDMAATHRDHMRVYHKRVLRNVPHGAVLFFGDSHVQGLCTAAAVPNAVNLGVGHATTESLLASLPNSGQWPDAGAIVYCIGVNDLIAGRPVDEVASGIAAILDATPEAVHVLLCGVFPVVESARAPLAGLNSQITDLNARLESLSSNRGIHFLDPRQFLLPDGTLHADLFEDDGLHLSQTGYSKWIDAMGNEFATLGLTQPAIR